MMGDISRVVRAFLRSPWLVTHERLDQIAGVLTLRAAGVQLSKEEIAAAIGVRPVSPGTPHSTTIGVVPIHGTIFPRGGMVNDCSGGMSAHDIRRNIDKALADPNIDAVVLDIDSPVGAVSGTQELAEHIFQSRGKKPIYAMANDMAASAAFWIGSAADEFYAVHGGQVGSVGVYMIHVDESKADEKEGLKYTIISEGKYKAEGHSHEPLTEEAREHFQEHVSEIYESFVGALARNRGVSTEHVTEAFGQGRLVDTSRAVSAGMIDGVLSAEDLYSLIAQNPKSVRSALRSKEEAMELTEFLTKAGLGEDPEAAVVELAALRESTSASVALNEELTASLKDATDTIETLSEVIQTNNELILTLKTDLALANAGLATREEDFARELAKSDWAAFEKYVELSKNTATGRLGITPVKAVPDDPRKALDQKVRDMMKATGQSYGDCYAVVYKEGE